MKKNYILYIVISIICVVAIGIAVYYQIFVASQEQEYLPGDLTNITDNENPSDEPEMDQVKAEFNELFKNNINFQKNTVTGVQKLDETKEIVYTAYAIDQEQDGKYDVNINIPVVNIQGETPTEYNQITQRVFADKAADVLNKATEFTVYNVDYSAYINGNILSIAIKSTLKEERSAQRIIVQTYNYDLQTGDSIELNDVLSIYGKDPAEVNEKIAREVGKAAEQAEALGEAVSQTGQTIYKRDLNSAIYITDNVSNFFVGKDGAIYIIYAYGNANATSELDIIKVD